MGVAPGVTIGCNGCNVGVALGAKHRHASRGKRGRAGACMIGGARRSRVGVRVRGECARVVEELGVGERETLLHGAEDALGVEAAAIGAVSEA